MRRRLVTGLALVAGSLVLATSAGAAETYAKGMAVARELSDRQGHRFLFTVTPPADRGVEARVFELFELSDHETKNARPGSTPKPEGALDDGGEAVDLSGFRIKIESVAMASCDLDIPLVKFKKVNLGGHKFVNIDVVGASAMFVSAYPTKGDVDAAITVGSAETVCDISEKAAGQFDIANCFESNCNASNDFLTGGVYNPFSSQATWVGAVSVVFAH